MYHITATIEGIADFLFNRMTEEDLSDFRSGASGGKLTDEQRSKKAEGKVYQDEAGLILPAWTIKKLFLNGAFEGKLKLAKKPLHRIIAAMVFVQGSGRFVNDRGKPVTERDYMHEVPGRTPPRTGTMTIVRRPALKAGWRVRMEVAVLDDSVPSEALKDALSNAGLYVGAGSWRPEFGRFIVVEWTMSKEAKKGKK